MNLRQNAFRLLAAVILWAVLEAPAFTAIPNPPENAAELLKRGEEVYRADCIGCHGEKGDGEGLATYGLHPKPRNFVTGTFKFRTTPTGALPADDDLARTIRNGLRGSAMPAFSLMSESDIRSVIQYIKTFSEAWKDPYKYEYPVSLTPPPAWFSKPLEKRKKHIEAGAELFKLYCLSCHGEKGDGKGPAAPTLTDEWGGTIRPADLRKPYVKTGKSPFDIYRTLVTGLNGVPMPSYRDSATDEQLWEIITYIESLRDEHKKSQPMKVML